MTSAQLVCDAATFNSSKRKYYCCKIFISTKNIIACKCSQEHCDGGTMLINKTDNRHCTWQALSADMRGHEVVAGLQVCGGKKDNAFT
jgi:hypothetical protein